MKKTISQYANAVASSSGLSGKSSASSSSPAMSAASVSAQEKIQRILASQWDSRLRRVDNKFVKTSRLSEGGEPQQPQQQPQQQQPPKSPTAGSRLLLRESRLELNQSLLERLRNPSQQVQFYEAIQESMQRPDKTPPKLLNGASSVNPGQWRKRHK